MRYSTSSIGMAVFIAAGCVPLGFELAWSLRNRSPLAAWASSESEQSGASGVGGALKPAAAEEEDFGFAKDSALLGEWRRLHKGHGNGPEVMPALFRAVLAEEDGGNTFRRRALLTALVSEWAEVDPAGGLEFLIGDEAGELQRTAGEARWDMDHDDGAWLQLGAGLFRQWLVRDSRAALEELKNNGFEEKLLETDPSLLSEIARFSPGSLAQFSGLLAGKDGAWNGAGWPTPAGDAFALMAEQNPDAAREAALSVVGSRYEGALAGVARAWGKKDFAAAEAWVKTLPGGPGRDGALRSALQGLAAANPKGALEKLSLAPAGGDWRESGSTTAGHLLREAAVTDFDATMEWLRDHSGNVAKEDLRGLEEAVGRGLNADPVKFLDAEFSRGTLGLSLSSIKAAVADAAGLRVPEIWEWLKGKPDSPDLRGLRLAMVNAAAYGNQDLALSMARDLPDAPESAKALDQLAEGLLTGRRMNASQLDELFANAPPALKTRLSERAFDALTPLTFDDAAQWTGRLAEVSPGVRPQAIERLASVWAVSQPRQASEWASGLPEGEGRREAVDAVARRWLAADPIAASEWIAAMPAGPVRDAGARAVVSSVAGDSPEEAWAWANSIGEASLRSAAVKQVLARVAAQGPDEAQDWLNRSILPETAKQLIRDQWMVEAARYGQSDGP